MDCPRCAEVVDDGAAYCGNCGAALTKVAIAPAADPAAQTVAPVVAEPASLVVPIVPSLASELPAYALASPSQHKAETKSMIALILSVLAVPGAIVPILGWLLATTGIVMASINRPKMRRKLMNDFALGFGILSILLSSGVFVYSFQQQGKKQLGQDRSGSPGMLAPITDQGELTITSDSYVINTPCYSVDVPELENVENAIGSCKAQAFNADTLLASTNAFNIEGVSQNAITEANLAEAGQEIANNYLRTTMPDLVIASQASGSFAGSPAYIISGSSKGNVTLELALVLHKVPHGENVFVLAHAVNNAKADLSQFEDGWKWK